MRLIEREAGLLIVEDRAGYAFVFQVHDEVEVDLVDRHWEGVGPAPDAGAPEQQARRLAEYQARSQVWL